MTKADFESIKKNIEKLDKLQCKIDDLLYKSVTGSQKLTGMPFVSGTSDKVGDYVTRLAELEDKQLSLLIRTKELIKKAKQFLNEIPDDTIRLSLYFIYLQGKDEVEVAEMVGIYGGKREKTLHKIINIFFLDSLLYML